MLGEYNKSASSPFQKLNETMQNTAYTTHTYKHTTIGFLADIKDMPNQYAYSKVFFDRWYRPENCTIIVAGDVKHDALVALVQAVLRRLEAGQDAGRDPRRAAPDGAEGRAADLAAADAADPVPGLSHPGRRPRQSRHGRARALEQALFGETSPLYKELVLKEQKVVMLTAEAEAKRDPGLFAIVVRVRKPEDLPVVRVTDRRGPGRGRQGARSTRLDWTRSSRISAMRSPARCARPTPSPTRSARPWRPRAARSRSTSCLPPTTVSLRPTSSAWRRSISSPATRRPSSSRRRSRNDHEPIHGHVGRRPILLAAAMTVVWPLRRAGRRGQGVARSSSADALALAIQSAGRASGRAPGRLAERPARQGGPGRPDRRDGRRRGNEIALLRPAPRGVLPDGRHRSTAPATRR